MASFFSSDPVPGDTLFEAGTALDLRSRVLAYERHLIAAALVETGGNQRRAARLLGILPTTLHEKRKRLGLRGAATADAAPPGPRETPA
jgi:DNA-binding NtrC family response regulator